MKRISTWVLASLFFMIGFGLVYAQMEDKMADEKAMVQETATVAAETMNTTENMMNGMDNMVGNMVNDAMENADEAAGSYLDEAEENTQAPGAAAETMNATK